MKVLIIILMLISTIYAISCIAENGKEVKVGDTTASKHLTKLGCIAIAIVAVAYDIANVYLLVHGG